MADNGKKSSGLSGGGLQPLGYVNCCIGRFCGLVSRAVEVICLYGVFWRGAKRETVLKGIYVLSGGIHVTFFYWYLW